MFLLWIKRLPVKSDQGELGAVEFIPYQLIQTYLPVRLFDSPSTDGGVSCELLVLTDCLIRIPKFMDEFIWDEFSLVRLHW